MKKLLPDKDDLIFMTKLFILIMLIVTPAFLYRTLVIDPQLDETYAEIYGMGDWDDED